PHMSDISLSNYSQTSVTLVGYLYKSKMYNIIGQYVGDMWFPTNLNSTRTLSYSIHTYDPTVGIESNEMTDFVFSIYPNPTYDLLNISVEILNPIDLEVSIYDSYGRLLINENKLNLTTGTNIFQINTSSLRSGVHIIQLKSNRSILIQKFTKI
ncbi:MAG: T9SS type A sorting domain-containing protein, partial [Bacteroidales bacterium]|nr:T9SS type A sorting domain-containing protein [Bacteroidales bacterium]